MKIFINLFFSSLSALAFAQCQIDGQSEIVLGSSASYSIEKEAAQCKECHLWKSGDANILKLGSEKRLNTIEVTAQQLGSTVLSISFLSPSGTKECQKEVKVIAQPQKEIVAAPKPTNDSCDIDISDFKEVKINDGHIMMLPLGQDSNTPYQYLWDITYFNNQAFKFKEKTPNVSYNINDGIKDIKLKITSKKCIKELSKAYQTTFWYYL
ncbi:hypothetical protein [Riemerella columbina]|uniref:hypothetical protein n=1 Tax=Riemerella columbina TaxID=103810 RepID=UPI00266FCBCB|nr:hypothetical protein [Riemerella columbina]WKS94906.1 hypothetical protein NYR17_08245 [Riemerella columbina]